MSNEVINKGIARLAYQFINSEKFIEFLTSFLAEFQYLQDQNIELNTMRTLDTAQGAQLDGIGEIVGLPRPTEPVDIIGAFGFLADPTSKGFGTVLSYDTGGNFLSINAVDSQAIGDDLYRLLLRAKIIENTTVMTVDETTELISFMLSGLKVRYFCGPNLDPRYDIIGTLDDFQQNLLSDLPVLIGIDHAEYHMYADGATTFSFNEDSEGLGFGTLVDPLIGGNFAQII